MISLGTSTKLKPEHVIARALQFFGPEGVGLAVDDSGTACARFTGAGGFVQVSACEGEQHTEVSLEAREWESQARQFLARLP